MDKIEVVCLCEFTSKWMRLYCRVIFISE